MYKEIGVFEEEGGETANAGNAHILKVFHRVGHEWTCVRQQMILPIQDSDLTMIRSNIINWIDFFGGCRLVIASRFSGIVLHELEKAGFELWELQGTVNGFLDQIADSTEDEQRKTVATEPDLPLVRMLPDGRKRIDIVEVQRSSNGTTSKQVLFPILSAEGFDGIDITCAHVPPWIEARITAEEWASNIERQCNGEYLLQIFVERKAQ